VVAVEDDREDLDGPDLLELLRRWVVALNVHYAENRR
jgi:hypothetical protein